MKASDDRLESLGLGVSDGVELDWESAAAAAADEDERKLITNLRSLSLVAGFFRECHGQARPLTAGERWGHLEILEHIGRGGYADVYRARDTELNREVALKLIRGRLGENGAVPSIPLEGERLARVKHPHLVMIHGASVREGALGLWMEYVRGTTLQDLVRGQGPLGAREAALIGIELCGALAALHAAGLLHRDIKAQNVMREQGGRIVLMDLGAGAEIVRETGCPPAAVSGTPLYMAPEVLKAASDDPTLGTHRGDDTRADLYSLGVLLYFTVTGTYPVRAETLAELRRKHADGERHRLRDVRPDLPAPFVAVIERALSPEPERRFASAGEMEMALSAALGLGEDGTALGLGEAPTALGHGQNATRRPAGEGLPGRPGHRPASGWVPGIIALGVVAAAALVGMLIWPGWLATPYTVHATLHRVALGGDQELLPGARVAPGDRLYLEFEASRDMHVYVMAEDDRGEAYLLFPLPGSTTANPLAGKSSHRLPPDRGGVQFTWGVSSAGGTEHVLIVASPEQLTGFEQALAALPAPRESGSAEGSAVPLDAQALGALRGIGLLHEQGPGPDPTRSRPVFALARQLAGGPERHRGTWVRQIDLVNPGP